MDTTDTAPALEALGVTVAPAYTVHTVTYDVDIPTILLIPGGNGRYLKPGRVVVQLNAFAGDLAPTAVQITVTGHRVSVATGKTGLSEAKAVFHPGMGTERNPIPEWLTIIAAMAQDAIVKGYAS